MKVNTAWGVKSQFGNHVLKMLEKHYKVQTVLNGSKMAIIRFKEIDFYIHDNGGEFHICKINHHDLLPDVPYTIWDRPINVATAAFRIAEVLKGKSLQEIDWDYEVSEETSLKMVVFKNIF